MRCELSIGIVIVPRFTMLALSALLDTLRLAADEADRSRPIRCSWTVMTPSGRPVVASNGITIEPSSALVDPARFDYVAVVSGTLDGRDPDPAVQAYLQRAASAGVPLIGLCTGSFVLADAGLLKGYRACISWLHRDQLANEFPDVRVVGDALYVIDRDRITCAGGTSVIHLASMLIDRHLGPGSANKGLRIMLEDRHRDERSTQPPPPVSGLKPPADARVRRALLEMERSPDRPVRVKEMAARLKLSERQLHRLFASEVGCSVAAFGMRMRLERAHTLVLESDHSMTQIAIACGFADAAHFSRSYRRHFLRSPTMDRQGSVS